MALTSWSASNYLRRLSQVYDTYPFMISAWGFRGVTVNAVNMIEVGTSASADHVRGRLQASGTNNRLEAQSRSTSNAAASLALDAPLSTWFHIAGEFIATNSRAVLQDGANRVSDATSVSPNASNSVHVGVRSDASSPWPSGSGLAEASIWNCSGMTTGNMDSLAVKLAAGENPINIDAEAGQPWTGLLVAYWPLTNTSDLADATGNGHDLTMVGTLTNHASHPTIDAVDSGITDAEIAMASAQRGYMPQMRFRRMSQYGGIFMPDFVPGNDFSWLPWYPSTIKTVYAATPSGEKV
jgi:hypothetical protein